MRLPLARIVVAFVTGAALCAAAQTPAPAPAPSPFATTKLADDVYLFRYGGHQSIFIVTPAGVIATDPNLSDVSDAARELAAKGQCLNDEAMRGVKLPKYEKWGAYNTYLFGNVERFCEYWGRGI